MKSHVFQMKYFLAGIYIICVIFTCFNARFYHTPLAKISSVTEKETMSRKGTRDVEEYYYTQKITARILNGTHKGEEISISNEYTSSQVQNQKYHKGDTVLLSGSRENPGKSIRSIKRDGYLALLAGGLFFSSDLYYRKTGILYDHIVDIEHNYIRVWISGFYERGKYLKYLQCNCFSFFDNNSDLSEWNPQKKHGLLLFQPYAYCF